MRKTSRKTDMVHGIHTCHITTMDLVPPIHLTSTFRFRDADHGAGIFSGTDTGYVYTRIGNPTVDLLAEKMAVLEETQGAVPAASGMAAVASVALTLAGAGDNMVCCSTLYGGTFALFNQDLKKFNIEGRFLPPFQCCDDGQIRKLIDARTRFLFIETPANPTLDIIDIERWAAIAASAGIPLVVDNTFASPYLQRPIALGADIVVHSATKYLGGHGDIIGGVVVGKAEIIERIKSEYFSHFGAVMSPFNAWLFLRGIKTLAVRMERHCQNAQKVAEWLEQHPKISRVFYPGLPSHPGHKTAQKQMDGFGGMIAFEVKGGIEAGKAVMNRVKLCILAVSLGDCETLIQHPASMTHATYTSAERNAAGITDGLIRLSVGIEEADDIIEDLDQAIR